jgi:hypothetical protein
MMMCQASERENRQSTIECSSVGELPCSAMERRPPVDADAVAAWLLSRRYMLAALELHVHMQEDGLVCVVTSLVM